MTTNLQPLPFHSGEGSIGALKPQDWRLGALSKPLSRKSAKNAAKMRRISAANFDSLYLRGTYPQWCENYSDLFPPCAKITATNHYRFAQFLARTLKEMGNSERTFQRFREAPCVQSAFFVQF
jgi:hypothetical protein